MVSLPESREAAAVEEFAEPSEDGEKAWKWIGLVKWNIAVSFIKQGYAKAKVR